jgi:hypothetical protein
MILEVINMEQRKKYCPIARGECEDDCAFAADDGGMKFCALASLAKLIYYDKSE